MSYIYRALETLITKANHLKKKVCYINFICFMFISVLEALNMEKMMSAVSCWMENPGHSAGPVALESAQGVPILIIEGFLLFNYR